MQSHELKSTRPISGIITGTLKQACIYMRISHKIDHNTKVLNSTQQILFVAYLSIKTIEKANILYEFAYRTESDSGP